MGVCRYYLKGTCWYGDKCRYEHPTASGTARPTVATQQVKFKDSFGVTSGQQHQYKWSGQTPTNPLQSPTQPVQQNSAEDVINGLPKEMQTWEQSKMWPFSCVALEKEMPSLPDFYDISPEELRLQAYTAMKDGTQDAYVARVTQLITDYNNKRHQLKFPPLELKQKLVQLLEQQRKKELTDSMTSSVFGASAASSTSFGVGTGLFGKPAEPSSPPANQGAFGSLPANQNTFGSPPANQNTFGSPPANQNTFGSPPANQTTFGSPPANQNTFASPPTNQGLFGAGGFASAESRSMFGGSSGGTTTTTTGLFASPAPAASFGAGASSTSSFGGSSAKANLFGGGAADPNLGQTFGGGAFGGGSFGLFGKPASTQGQTTPGQTTHPASPGQTSGGQGFGSAAASPPSGLFGKPVPPQGQTTPGSGLFTGTAPQECSGSTVYTPLDQLTEAEKSQFCAPAFVLGKVPTKPPPLEYILEQVR